MISSVVYKDFEILLLSFRYYYMNINLLRQMVLMVSMILLIYSVFLFMLVLFFDLEDHFLRKEETFLSL